jgi:hypothetical protein
MSSVVKSRAILQDRQIIKRVDNVRKGYLRKITGWNYSENPSEILEIPRASSFRFYFIPTIRCYTLPSLDVPSAPGAKYTSR